MSKSKTTSLTSLFQQKGNAVPTTPVVQSVVEEGAPSVTVERQLPEEEATLAAAPEPSPAPTPVNAAKTPKAAPVPPAAPAVARPMPKETGGALISTTVKLDQARYKEVKMAGVMTGKTFQDIAVEAIDLWLAANGNQG